MGSGFNTIKDDIDLKLMMSAFLRVKRFNTIKDDIDLKLNASKK